jgi:hypothetical protein
MPKKLEGVLIHEIGHADDALFNFAFFIQEAYDIDRGAIELDPDPLKRPNEIRNQPYMKRVLAEIKKRNKNIAKDQRLHPTLEIP